MSRKRIIFRIVPIIILIIAAGIILYYFSILNNFVVSRASKDEASMVECTLSWGRLNDFPASKTDFNIKAEGNSFTRAFRSSFFLPKEDLDRWIKTSPGLQDSEVTSPSDTKKIYQVKPGGNASTATVTIDCDTNFVEVYVSWS